MKELDKLICLETLAELDVVHHEVGVSAAWTGGLALLRWTCKERYTWDELHDIDVGE